MAESLTLFDTILDHDSKALVDLFDPPMCCPPTGLCGTTLDQTLLDVNEQRSQPARLRPQRQAGCW
jgi:hypothetical protein